MNVPGKNQSIYRIQIQSILCTLVHEFDRLIVDKFDGVPVARQGVGDLFLVSQGLAVAGNQVLGLVGQHLIQDRCPYKGIPER